MTDITRRILAAAASIGMLLGVPLSPARADTRSIDVAAETDIAALYKYAKARYAAGDVLGAFEAYQRSCDIQPTMEACANAGSTAYQLGRYPAAATLLRTALGLMPPTLELESARKKVRDKLAEAKARCGELLISVEPTGATILLNHRQLDKASMVESLFVGAGQHRITIRMDGYQPVTLTTKASAGSVTRLPVSSRQWRTTWKRDPTLKMTYAWVWASVASY